MASSKDPAGSALGALADPTRRALLADIVHSGPITATALARDYSVSRQAIVKHLAVLCEAGVLATDRVANEVRYRVATAPLFAAAAWLAGLGATWDGRQTTPPRRRIAGSRSNRAART